MTDSNIADEVDNLVRDIGRLNRDDTLERTTDLFDSGYLDSLGIVTLSTFIEQRYGLTLAEADFFDPRLNTINGIAELITAHTKVPALTSPKGVA